MNIYNDDGSKRPRLIDADRIKLGQRIEAQEARTGEPSKQRLLAERAIEAFRQAKSWEEAHELCMKNDVFLELTDTKDKDGKVKFGGVIKAGDGSGIKVRLSALPQDCSYKNLDKRFSSNNETRNTTRILTSNQAKFHARAAFNASTTFAGAEAKLKEKGMSIERHGKSGAYLVYGPGEADKMKLTALGSKYSLSALSKKYNETFPLHASFMHESKEKVNAPFNKSATDFKDKASKRVQSTTERAASVAAEAIQAKTLSEALDDAFAQAHSLDALRKARLVAAQANNRAEKAEERAQKAEQALSASQPPKNIEQKQSKVEDNNMFGFTKNQLKQDLETAKNIQNVPSMIGKKPSEVTQEDREEYVQRAPELRKDPMPSWIGSGKQEQDYTEFEANQYQEHSSRLVAVQEHLRKTGVDEEKIGKMVFALSTAIFAEQKVEEEKMQKTLQNSSTDNNDNKKTEAKPAMTLAEKVAEAIRRHC